MKKIDGKEGLTAHSGTPPNCWAETRLAAKRATKVVFIVSGCCV